MKTSYVSQNTLLTIENINFITVQRTQGYRTSFPGGRNHHAFIYPFSGSMHYKFVDSNNEDIVASSGELVFIPKKTQHTSTYLDAENDIGVVQFDLIQGELPNYLNTPSLIKIDNSEEIFCSFRADLKAGAVDNPIYFLYRMYELFWHISKQINKVPYKFRKLLTALKEMNLHYSENQKIAYYADISGMSEPGFRRLFNEYIGFSPIKYRNRIRLQEAKKMLRSGEYRISEVAEAVGFSNLSFFCRSYKQLFGYSPSKEN